jgi:rhamnose utilization protein RhaD (predicted bifunctional aldolase and dehydrogenase)
MAGNEHRPQQVILDVIGHRVVKLPYRLPSFQLTIKSVGV